MSLVRSMQKGALLPYASRCKSGTVSEIGGVGGIIWNRNPFFSNEARLLFTFLTQFQRCSMLFTCTWHLYNDVASAMLCTLHLRLSNRLQANLPRT